MKPADVAALRFLQQALSNLPVFIPFHLPALPLHRFGAHEGGYASLIPWGKNCTVTRVACEAGAFAPATVQSLS